MIRCGELLVLLGDEEVVVIDCRTPEDWEAVAMHIPGALHMPLVDLAQNSHVLPDDEMIVLVGWERDDLDALRARQLLLLRGHRAVCLEGGLRGWIRAGYPLERHGERWPPGVTTASR
ncbi:MAG: rhodanese-like domain-containing protein [Myxococcota bacterium]